MLPLLGKQAIWASVAFGLKLIFILSLGFSQVPWAALDRPPTGIAPAGDVLRPSHLGRQVGNVELIIHFYHDLLGLDLLGARGQPRPFGSKGTNPALLEFVQRGQGVANPMDARNRAVILPIPGTSAAKGSEMAIEAIEIKNIPARPYRPGMADPGASHIKLLVRNLDKTLAILKDELVPVITFGGKPVILTSYPGIAGEIRAVFVRDPDGYPVGLFEIASAPPAAAAAQSNVVGARICLVVDDLETTCRWFQHLVGPEFKFWLSPGWLGGDRSFTDLTNTPGQFRMALAMIPGSPVVMEFIEYQEHIKNFVRPNFQDPGAAHILFMSRDVDLIMTRARAAGLRTLSATDGPVFIGPTTRSFFVTDPDGFWAEFMDHGVKKKP